METWRPNKFQRLRRWAVCIAVIFTSGVILAQPPNNQNARDSNFSDAGLPQPLLTRRSRPAPTRSYFNALARAREKEEQLEMEGGSPFTGGDGYGFIIIGNNPSPKNLDQELALDPNFEVLQTVSSPEDQEPDIGITLVTQMRNITDLMPVIDSRNPSGITKGPDGRIVDGWYVYETRFQTHTSDGKVALDAESLVHIVPAYRQPNGFFARGKTSWLIIQLDSQHEVEKFQFDKSIDIQKIFGPPRLFMTLAFNSSNNRVAKPGEEITFDENWEPLLKIIGRPRLEFMASLVKRHTWPLDYEVGWQNRLPLQVNDIVYKRLVVNGNVVEAVPNETRSGRVKLESVLRAAFGRYYQAGTKIDLNNRPPYLVRGTLRPMKSTIETDYQAFAKVLEGQMVRTRDKVKNLYGPATESCQKRVREILKFYEGGVERPKIFLPVQSDNFRRGSTREVSQ